MAGITNIKSSMSNSNDKAVSKLTFEVGQTFEAKAESVDIQNGEVILKTKDGWRFTAKLENPLELSNNEFSSFVVQGYEDGELNIKLIPSNNSDNTAEDSMTAILKQYCDSNGKEDIDLLKNLIEHNIPLTKENISSVKTIMEFKKNISNNSAKEDEFISNYLNSKGIDENSERGVQIKSILKDFFANLKSIDLDEITVFKESMLDLTGKNIKSFNNIFKGDAAIYNTLKEISDSIMTGSTRTDNVTNKVSDGTGAFEKTVKFSNENIASSKVLGTSEESKIIDIASGNTEKNGLTAANSVKNELTGEIQESTNKSVSDNNKIGSEFLDKLNKNVESSEEAIVPSNKTILEFKKSVLVNEIRTDDLISDYLKENGISKSSIKGQEIRDNFNNFFNELKELDTSEIKNLLQNGSEAKGFGLIDIKQIIQENAGAFNEFKKIMSDLEKLNETANNKQNELANMNGKANVNENREADRVLAKMNVNAKLENTNLGKLVSSEINTKINEMKNIISDIINKNSENSPVFEKVMNVLNNNINDFKVFNSLSKEYYYVDVPVNFLANQYNCKLILKDDRKSGKKLDSTNIKIAASVNTVNMGIVDAYIYVKNKNISVDIKAEENFTKILEVSKKNLLSKINDKGYLVNLKVEEKEKQEHIDLVSCTKFFNDDSIISIDTKV